MKTIHIFSKEEQEQLLKDFCKVNHYSYHMICEIMFKNLLGETSAEAFMVCFKHYLSGKLGICITSINFE